MKKDISLEGRRKKAAERVFKHFFLYFYSDVFGNYFLEEINKLKVIKDKEKLEGYIKKYQSELSILMSIRRVPPHWFITFRDAIEKGEMNLPLHESIYLSVNDYPIINHNFDEEKVKRSRASSVSIEVVSKVTNNQIRGFIELNGDLIVRIEKLLNLPELEVPRADNFGEGTMTYLDIEGKKIAGKKTIKDFVGDKVDSQDEIDRIEKMLRNYKKYLSSKK